MKTSAPSTPNLCYRYGEPEHYANHCPKKQNQQTPQGQRSSNTRKVNHVSTEIAQTEAEVMLGTFNVHSTPATIFFYSGASHTFISNIFVRMHSVPMLAMKEHLLVNSPGGTMQTTNRCLPVSMVLRG
jgi:hypothetical protein